MKSPNTGRIPLIKDRDFTLRQDGRMVFSREYLITRGTCCGSECLNCPYTFSDERPDPLQQRPVISFVPSLTETLVAAGARVVGRTRFCIHPNDAVPRISSLGGTKNFNDEIEQSLERIDRENRELKGRTDWLIVLDREENPKDFSDFFIGKGMQVLATHANTLNSLENDFRALSEAFVKTATERDQLVATRLQNYAERISKVASHKNKSTKNAVENNQPQTLFGRALIKATTDSHAFDAALMDSTRPIVYVIWQNPWMAVAGETWVATVLSNVLANRTGIRDDEIRRRIWPLAAGETKYPKFEFKEVPERAIVLFSSEPFPFEGHWSKIKTSDVSKRVFALVDGEPFSWFGLRSLRYLEESV